MAMFYLEPPLASHLAKIIKEDNRFTLFIDRLNYSNSVSLILFLHFLTVVFVSLQRFLDNESIALEPPEQILLCLLFIKQCFVIYDYVTYYFRSNLALFNL